MFGKLPFKLWEDKAALSLPFISPRCTCHLLLGEFARDLQHTGEKAKSPEDMAIVGCHVVQYSHYVLFQHCLKQAL